MFCPVQTGPSTTACMNSHLICSKNCFCSGPRLRVISYRGFTIWLWPGICLLQKHTMPKKACVSLLVSWWGHSCHVASHSHWGLATSILSFNSPKQIYCAGPLTLHLLTAKPASERISVLNSVLTQTKTPTQIRIKAILNRILGLFLFSVYPWKSCLYHA